MPEFRDILSTRDLPDGSMRKSLIDGQVILIARRGDRYFAADNRCPHMGGDLSMGTLEETVVTCPRHHSRFDLTDGRVLRWTDWTGMKLTMAKMVKSPRPLRIHEVKIEGERILVRLRE